jgi:hypothetical protein
MTSPPQTGAALRIGAVVALVSAPLLIVAGNALHPVVAANSAAALLDAVAGNPGRWIAAKLLYGCGSLLLIVAMASVVRLSPRPVILVGAILAGIGTGFNAMSQALTGYTAYTVIEVDVDRTAGGKLLESYDTLGAIGFPVSFATVPVLLIGMITVGIGLIVAKVVPWPAGALLIVGTLSAGVVQAGPWALLAGAPLIGAFVLLARARLTLDPASPTRP